jgi:hypothetical protein
MSVLGIGIFAVGVILLMIGGIEFLIDAFRKSRGQYVTSCRAKRHLARLS